MQGPQTFLTDPNTSRGETPSITLIAGKLLTRVVHILPTFESFKTDPFKLGHFMKKKLV